MRRSTRVPSMQAAKLVKRDAEDCSKVFTRRASWLACIRCHNMRVLSRSKCSTIETGTADRKRRPKVPCGELAMLFGTRFLISPQTFPVDKGACWLMSFSWNLQSLIHVSLASAPGHFFVPFLLSTYRPPLR